MNKYEQFIHQEIQPLLSPNESVESLGFIYSFMGGGYFFAVATNHQLLLIETEMGFSSLKTINKNLIQIPYGQIEVIKTGGFFNQKTIMLRLKTGKKMRFRLNTFANLVPGQKQFIKNLLNLHQLAPPELTNTQQEKTARGLLSAQYTNSKRDPSIIDNKDKAHEFVQKFAQSMKFAAYISIFEILWEAYNFYRIGYDVRRGFVIALGALGTLMLWQFAQDLQAEKKRALYGLLAVGLFTLSRWILASANFELNIFMVITVCAYLLLVSMINAFVRNKVLT